MSTLPPTPIFEPELSFLPHGCEACGSRFSTSFDLDLHRRETCHGRELFPPHGSFNCGGWFGVADGGRRT